MGSFNVACGISNIAIQEGDETGFVILAKGTGPERTTPGVGVPYFLSDSDLFKPFLPPVFGVYGDYGNLADIKASKTTEVLESMFGQPIEKIMECITCSRDLYDPFSKIFETYFKGSKSFQEFEATHEESLKELGFTKVPASGGKFSKMVSGKNEEVFQLGGYEIVLRPAKDIPQLPFWSIRETGTQKAITGEFRSQFISEPIGVFSRVTGLFPGYDKADYEKIEILNKFYGMFFLKDAFTGMLTYLTEEDSYSPQSEGAYRKMWDDYVKLNNAIKSGHEKAEILAVALPHADLFRFVERNTALKTTHWGYLNVYGEGYDYIDLPDLMSVMASVNRMFVPSFCGSQDGDTKASLALNAITGRVLAERKSWQYDDEDIED